MTVSADQSWMSGKRGHMFVIEGMALNVERYYGEPGKGRSRHEIDHIVTSDGVEIYPFVERLVIDLHPLDEPTGRTRDRVPIVGIR